MYRHASSNRRMACMCVAGMMNAGDKVETAISIAYSCRLFTDDMGIIEMREQEFLHASDPDSVIQVCHATP